jgi:hypothetical protein
MTYVTDQTSSELRSHMRWLTSLAGWHDPLADRLWKDVQEQDTELRRLHEVNVELLDALKEIAAPNAFNSDHRVEAFREALREIARAAIAKAEVTK